MKNDAEISLNSMFRVFFSCHSGNGTLNKHTHQKFRDKFDIWYLEVRLVSCSVWNISISLHFTALFYSEHRTHWRMLNNNNNARSIFHLYFNSLCYWIFNFIQCQWLCVVCVCALVFFFAFNHYRIEIWSVYLFGFSSHVFEWFGLCANTSKSTSIASQQNFIGK